MKKSRIRPEDRAEIERIKSIYQECPKKFRSMIHDAHQRYSNMKVYTEMVNSNKEEKMDVTQ